jgi:hypothetical protein
MFNLRFSRTSIGLAAIAATVAGAAATGITPAIGAPTAPIVVRYSEDVIVPAYGPVNRQARVSCLRGETATGGGAAVRAVDGTSGSGGFLTHLVRTAPLPDTAPQGVSANGWMGEATNMSAHYRSPEDSVLRAFVVCSS